MIHAQTIYELKWGGQRAEQIRYFSVHKANDAYVRAAERILAADSDPEQGGAYVHLKRLPDTAIPAGCHLIAWTKTSNECPTQAGTLHPYTEEMCPGHVASAGDSKVCGLCGVHVSSFAPEDDYGPA